MNRTTETPIRNNFTPLQEKWLTDLESGEFRQATMNLTEYYDDERGCLGMCCLGVATNAVNPDHDAIRHNGWDRHAWAEDHDLELDEVAQYGDDECTAPPDVVDALNLVNSEGKFRFGCKYKDHRCLINLNDKAGLTFKEIAAFIREKPWVVFTNFDHPTREVAA